jgi:hypothetical protein
MKKDLYSIRERDTNPFYEKDPGDYTNYKEDHPMSREVAHRSSDPSRRNAEPAKAKEQLQALDSPQESTP